MRTIILLSCAAAIACNRGDKPATAARADSISAARDTTQPVAMPPYPVAERGRMVVKSASRGTELIAKDWATEAYTCDNPPMIQIVAQELGVGGALVLLALPANRVTTYPVRTVERGLPTPPAAQVGVQYYGQSGAFQYQAAAGSVEIYSMDKTVSGRFAVHLRELNRNDRLAFAGSFKEVPVTALDAARCMPAAGGVTPGR